MGSGSRQAGPTPSSSAHLRGGLMSPAAVLKERAAGSFRRKPITAIQNTPSRPVVLIATIDPEIQDSLAQLLEHSAINAIWVGSVEDVKTVIARENIAACLCGFWLQDGTYREVIRHLRRERVEIPAIIVSSPTCPQEFRDYLAAMNLGALHFLCYPHQRSDFEKILAPAIAAHGRTAPARTAVDNLELRERGAA